VLVISPADLGETWALLAQLQQLITAQCHTEVGVAVERAGLSGRPLGMLIHAGDFDPQPLTAAGLQRCVPYYAAVAFTPRMVDLAAHGLLEPIGDGIYRLSVAGRAALDAIERAARTKLVAVQAQLGGAPARLDDLLRRLVAACRATPDVPDQACVVGTGNDRPNDEPTALGRIARSAYALLTYRCDAHRAAWQAHNITGPGWEIFAQVAGGQVASPELMFAWSQQQAVPRGYTAVDYTAYMHDLVERGWVAEAGGVYHATMHGRQLRREVEDLTDRFFYTPWSALDEAALAELHELAGQLIIQLEALGLPDTDTG
jgi:hypothetical protein